MWLTQTLHVLTLLEKNILDSAKSRCIGFCLIKGAMPHLEFGLRILLVTVMPAGDRGDHWQAQRREFISLQGSAAGSGQGSAEMN